MSSHTNNRFGSPLAARLLCVVAAMALFGGCQSCEEPPADERERLTNDYEPLPVQVAPATSAYTSDAGDDADTGPDDTCPVADGVAWSGESRFMYGVNYAWRYFAADFGGIDAWNQKSISEEPWVHRGRLREIRAHGGQVVRWWVFPDFRADGVVFDADDVPTGITEDVREDLRVALELADQEDVYLMLTLFSFDNFYPSQDIDGLWVPGIRPMVLDQQKRQSLLENVVRPLAREAQSSPYSDRLISWDVINEPEWAMKGPSPLGDPDYTPNDDLEAVTHSEMAQFIGEVIDVIRDESMARITVGAAAWKWKNAWTDTDLDYYQFHMYSWINDYWPYDRPADQWGLDLPIVMGEFPFDGMGSEISYADMVSTWFDHGYAGALAWQYESSTDAQLDAMEAFSQAHPCETTYGSAIGPMEYRPVEMKPVARPTKRPGRR